MHLVLTRQIFLRYGGYALVVFWIYTFSIPTYRLLENVLLGRYYYFDDLPFYFFAFCIAPIIFASYLKALDSSSLKTEHSKVKLISLWIFLWIISGLLLFFGLAFLGALFQSFEGGPSNFIEFVFASIPFLLLGGFAYLSRFLYKTKKDW
jgi:hypothetical protein